ncbi:MAG: hypothetical protein ACE5KD_03430 [Candidatus Bathyarchaeia archaeon]
MIVGLTEKLIVQRKGEYERDKLTPYILPLRKEGKQLIPIDITGELSKNVTLTKAKDLTIVTPETSKTEKS